MFTSLKPVSILKTHQSSVIFLLCATVTVEMNTLWTYGCTLGIHTYSWENPVQINPILSSFSQNLYVLLFSLERKEDILGIDVNQTVFVPIAWTTKDISQNILLYVQDIKWLVRVIK